MLTHTHSEIGRDVICPIWDIERPVTVRGMSKWILVFELFPFVNFV